jgi:hypothetical protein
MRARHFQLTRKKALLATTRPLKFRAVEAMVFVAGILLAFWLIYEQEK